MRMRGILKAVLFRFVAIVFGLLIAALVGEVTLRLVMPSRLASARDEHAFFCRFDRQLGWAPLENITAVHNGKRATSIVHQNQYGMRGPDDIQLNKTSGKKRVLVLGDSYVWGYGVDQSKLFSAPEVHRTDEEILNFGVSGYGTDQEYLLYLRNGKDFVVDEVVVAFTPYNDVANNLASEQYSYLKPYFTLEGGQLVLHDNHVRKKQFNSIANALNRHSRVLNASSELLRKVEDALNPAKPKEFASETVTDRDRAGVDLTVAILKKLQEAVAAHHAEFYVIFIPYKPHIEKHVTDNHPLVPLIAAGLTRAGISYREPYPEFLKAAVAGSHPFNDPDNHFSAEGHALFAKFLTDTEQARASVDYYAHH
jgi:SAM-dependent methyltransferase